MTSEPNMDRRSLLALSAAAFPPVLQACATSGAPPGPFELVVERNVEIPTRDGGKVVADIFRPSRTGRYPVIMSMGPYPKDVKFKDWSPADHARQQMKSGSGEHDHMHWETGVPDYWVANGYVQIRCDQRGSGASPGLLDVLGPQVQHDFCDAIEWAGVQAWSNGNVGLLGDSYFAAIQWLVAQHQPPHLKAMIPVSGFTDHYRDAVRHGGILSSRFLDLWFQFRVKDFQHGAPKNAATTPLTPAELDANNVWQQDFRQLLRERKLAVDPYFVERTPDLSRIRAAVYAHANSGGLGLHARGTIEGYRRATSAAYRHLSVATGTDPDALYTLADVEKFRRFFDRFLKGEPNGLEREPAVSVVVRDGARTLTRTGTDYPLPGTEPWRLFLDAGSQSLSPAPASTGSETTYRSAYGPSGSIARFSTAPLTQRCEIIGPLRLHLALSCSGSDADLFVALREIRPDGTEVTAKGATDPAVPVSMGWLRASMRKADPSKSEPYRTWHPYDEPQPLQPGTRVTLDVNLWPAAWAIQRGNRLVLEISGSEQAGMVTFAHPPAGPYRPGGVTPIDNGAPAASTVTLHCDPADPSYLVVPVFQAVA
jgi:predicted acyl esterase